MGLVGLVLAAPVAALGGHSTPLYDAHATYMCLKHRPEYRPLSWQPSPNEHTPHAAFQILDGGPRHLAYDPYNWFKVGPVWKIQTAFLANDLQSPALLFFDSVAKARTLWRKLLVKFAPYRARFLKDNKLGQNVFINWPPGPPAKSVRSIVLGCLLTR